MKRRNFIYQSSAMGFGLSFNRPNRDLSKYKRKASNKIKSSVCRWCYQSFEIEEIIEQCQDIGVDSIELLHQKEWQKVIDAGLNCAVAYANDLGLEKGFNDLQLHKQLQEDYTKIIPILADNGIQKVIAFSGNGNGLSRENGLENCARGLEPIIKTAEKYNITVVMELLNSKIDHPDYQCDHTDWGFALVEKIGSPAFKLLYDIYHMQIMEGNIINTINENNAYIAHYHTAGVPGRNEIEDNQEINYAAVYDAIERTGYDGFFAQEFIPTRQNPFESLRKSIEICS